MLRSIFIMGLALLLATLPMKAQVSYGVRAGAAHSSLIQKINDKAEAESCFGFSFAGLVDIPLSHNKKWSLRPEVAFVHQGGAYYSDQDMQGATLFNKCWYNSIEVPINVAYNFIFTDVRLLVYAGLTFDWAVFGRMESRESDHDLNFGMTEEKDLKPCDLALNLGVAFELDKFFVSLNSTTGMIDRRSTKRDGETSVYQNNITFSVGYYFRR